MTGVPTPAPQRRANKAKPLRARVTRMEGALDAIRFGELYFPDSNRWGQFRYDRLSGAVRLFNREGVADRRPFTEAHRQAATRAVHRQLEPL